MKIALRLLQTSIVGLLIAGTSGAQAIEPARHPISRSALVRPQEAASPDAQAVAPERATDAADIWMMIGVSAGLVALQLRRKQKSLQYPLTLT